MDKIFIHNLHIETLIGLYPHELTSKQTLILDLELKINAKKSALEDNIKDTIDYEKVVESIKRLSQQHSFKLLESYAEYIIANLLETFNTSWARLKITKPAAVKETREIGIIIERTTTESI